MFQMAYSNTKVRIALMLNKKIVDTQMEFAKANSRKRKTATPTLQLHLHS